LGQPDPHVVQRREDGVEPGDEQEEDEAEDLPLGQRLTLDDGVDDGADLRGFARACSEG
jgi:hypothetical protein